MGVYNPLTLDGKWNGNDIFWDGKRRAFTLLFCCYIYDRFK